MTNFECPECKSVSPLGLKYVNNAAVVFSALQPAIVKQNNPAILPALPSQQSWQLVPF